MHKLGSICRLGQRMFSGWVGVGNIDSGDASEVEGVDFEVAGEAEAGHPQGAWDTHMHLK